MVKFILKHKDILLIISGLIIIRFSENIRNYFLMSSDIKNLLLDAIFGLAIVLIGLLYNFKEVEEQDK
ncbi:hypothetical protein [Clostridium sp. HCS.1]|uniref:hypothetical protein n=1 Tax=Clostridium sp. HCS.1 TaxID=3238594 RepID=UPI003A10215D